jgi:hypothetical protein
MPRVVRQQICDTCPPADVRHIYAPADHMSRSAPHGSADVRTSSRVGGTGFSDTQPKLPRDAQRCYRLWGSASSPTIRRNARTAASYSSGASRLTS